MQAAPIFETPPPDEELTPFDDEVPAMDARGTFWVEPVLVVDVETHGVGYQRLRQPSYRGLRTDVRAHDLGGSDL